VAKNYFILSGYLVIQSFIDLVFSRQMFLLIFDNAAADDAVEQLSRQKFDLKQIKRLFNEQ
jgi:hypothetical protein